MSEEQRDDKPQRERIAEFAKAYERTQDFGTVYAQLSADDMYAACKAYLAMPSAVARRDYCESCGYTDSHDPNCPRPKETPEPTEQMVEAGARAISSLVASHVIEAPRMVEWQPWAGASRTILRAALSYAPAVQSATARSDAERMDEIRSKIAPDDERLEG